MSHPVIEFYLDQRKTEYKMSFDDFMKMPLKIVGDGYLYIPWLFPVTPSKIGFISKWNSKVPIFSEQDAIYFRQNEQLQTRFLQAFDFVISYFLLERQGNEIHSTPALLERNFWLRNIGHETKKISRIITSLANCGQPELAQNLQTLALKLGQEKGFLLPDTLEIWQKLLED